MSSTDSVVSLYLTPHLTIDLSPLEADLVTGKTSPPPDEQIVNLTARLKPYATKVLAAIAACHGRTQAVVLSAAAICVLRCADLLMGAAWAPGVVTEGKAISLVPLRAGYCLVAKGSPQGTLFGLTILSEKDTHFFPTSDGTANAKVDEDIWTRVTAAQAVEDAGVSQAALVAKVELTKQAGKAAALAQAELADKVRSMREEEAKRVAAGPKKSAAEKAAARDLYQRRCVVLDRIRVAVGALEACGGEDATEWAARELMVLASNTDRALFDKWCQRVRPPTDAEIAKLIERS